VAFCKCHKTAGLFQTLYCRLSFKALMKFAAHVVAHWQHNPLG